MPQPAQPFRHEQPPLPSDNSIANTQPQQTAARPSMVAPATPVQAPGAYNPPQQPSAAAMPPARMGQPQPAAPGNDKPIPSVVRNMPIRQDAPAPAPGVSVSNGHQRNSIEALHQPTIALQNSPKKLLLLKNQRLILAICVALIVIIVIAIVLILIFKSKS